jgi:ABC-type dipeptide/oligopeptide/nickel transport systems, permease components
MRYIIKKLISLVITIIIISICVFFSFQVIKGDPATSLLGTEGTPEKVAALREEMGLNAPLISQYGNWIGNALRGDFGISYSYKMPVKELINDKVAITMVLTGLSVVLLLVIGIPMGILTAKYNKKLTGGMLMTINQIFMALPSFFLGILMTYFLGLVLRWFKPGGYISYREQVMGFLGYLIFPAIAIAIPRGAMVAKLLKDSIETELKQDYVRTAYSKGNSKNKILYGHVLKNAIMPVITYLAFLIADIVAGSIIIEQVFSIPGLGRLLITSIANRDYPVVQALVVIIGILVISLNLIVDVVYRVLDPRMEV